MWVETLRCFDQPVHATCRRSSSSSPRCVNRRASVSASHKWDVTTSSRIRWRSAHLQLGLNEEVLRTFGELFARDLGSRNHAGSGDCHERDTLRYAQRAWRASRPPFDVNTGVTSEATSETIQRTKKSLRNAVAYPRSIPHPSFVISIHWAQVLGISNDQNVVADGPRLRRLQSPPG